MNVTLLINDEQRSMWILTEGHMDINRGTFMDEMLLINYYEGQIYVKSMIILTDRMNTIIQNY